ncbi:MAG TPA: spermidine/putrescine ABC transporter substrate-binding protein [Clostridiaceae bacterium]|nr:spermidine/putrescine ABC transporter substrate-binding protein [Clostridiaceae bacterium]
MKHIKYNIKHKKQIVKFMALILLLAVSVPLMTGCGGSKNGSGEKVVLNVYNWGDYIDETVNDLFEEKYGIKVNYETFATNEDMYTKIKSGAGKYDIAIPSDYMIKRMIDENLLNKINLDNIPNYKYIEDRFKNLAYDPNNEYSVPYMWGTVGILYNKTMVNEPVDSWKILWDEKYAKQILMLDSQRESIGVALQMLGYSMNSDNPEELEAAQNALIEQKHLVLAYVGDEIKDKMIGEEAALAVVWSGDAIYCKRENPNLDYAIPKEGSNLWFDAIVIPKTAEHQAEAEKYIDFLCDPEIAFKNADYIGYSSPNSGAKEMLDPSLLSDKTAYPDDEDIKNCEIFQYNEKLIKIYDEIWTRITAE